MRIGVINYGVGNFGSVMRALVELRVTPVLVERVSDLRNLDSLILPGVGNFADCVNLLNRGGWAAALKEEVQVKGKSLLGICLGMQLLATESMEGVVGGAEKSIAGLDFIPGKVVSLKSLGCNLRVPHVGWNDVMLSNQIGGLFDGIASGTDFYFVHSYVFIPKNFAHVLATTEYDVTVTAAVRCGNVWGTQFHPEKSSQAGFKLLKNFIEAQKC